MQRYLPSADLTILLDITPEIAARRKTADRDRYERDFALLARVRQSYLRQAAAPGWVTIDADRDRQLVAADVATAVERVLTCVRRPASPRERSARGPSCVCRTRTAE